MTPTTLALLASIPDRFEGPIYFEGLVLDLEVLYEIHQQFGARR
jgi:hypothetical protein